MPPTLCEGGGQGPVLSEEIRAAIPEGRLPHPRAPLQAREGAIEARLAECRARRWAEVAWASSGAAVSRASRSERPNGPHRGGPVAPRGPRERHGLTQQGQTRRWRRGEVSCPTCQGGGFPLG